MKSNMIDRFIISYDSVNKQNNTKRHQVEE